MVACDAGRGVFQPRLWLITGVAIALLPGCIGAPDGDYRPTELTGGFCLIKTSADQVIVSEDPRSGDAPMIPAKVVSVAIVGKTIMAKQFVVKTNSSGHQGGGRLWLLDTASRALEGPMSQSEFDEVVRSRFEGESIVFTDADTILRLAREQRRGY